MIISDIVCVIFSLFHSFFITVSKYLYSFKCSIFAWLNLMLIWLFPFSINFGFISTVYIFRVCFNSSFHICRSFVGQQKSIVLFKEFIIDIAGAIHFWTDRVMKVIQVLLYCPHTNFVCRNGGSSGDVSSSGDLWGCNWC